MPLGDFVEAGSVLRPLIIGRAGRLVFAAITLYVFLVNLADYSALVSSNIPQPHVLYWATVAVAWWYFSDLVVVSLGRPWGRRPQIAVFPIAATLVVADLAAYGSAWAPPLAWGVFLFGELIFGAFTVSFFLAGVLAVPG